MRKITFKRQSWKDGFSNSWKLVVFLFLPLMLLIAIWGYRTNDAQITEKTLKAEKVLAEQKNISELIYENQQYKKKVQAIEKIKNAKKVSDKELQDAIAVLFPEPKNMVKIANCENGKHTADRVNTNKDGSKDVGQLQINDKYHSKTVQKLFKQDFWTAMTNSAKNLVYGAIIHAKWGNSKAWVCDGLIVKGGE